MSEPKFDIHISTSADTKGVEQAKQALAELSRETKQLTTACVEQTEALDGQSEAAGEQAAAAKEQAAAAKEQAAALEAVVKAAEEQAAAAEAQAAAIQEEVAALEAQLKAEKEHKASLEAEAAATKKAEAAAESNIRTLASMEAELEELTTTMSNMDVASEAFAKTREEVNKLGGEIENLKSGGSPLASSMDKARDAIQGVSDVLDGAEDGIQGVLGSLPGLVTAFGGKAGLASGVGLATAALSLLIKQMSKLDYDGTWVGDFQEGFDELVTGMSKAEKEAKEIAEAPSKWMGNVEEQLEEQSAAMEEELRLQNELLREQRELQQQTLDLAVQQTEHKRRLAELNRPLGQQPGTPEWHASEMESAQLTFEAAEGKRTNALQKATDEKNRTQEDLQAAQAESSKAEKRVAGLKTRDDLQNLVKESLAGADRLKAQGDASMTRYFNERNPELRESALADYESAKKQRAQAEHHKARLDAKGQNGMPLLPGLFAGETVEGLKADLAAKQKATNDAQIAATAAANQFTTVQSQSGMQEKENKALFEKSKREADDAVKQRQEKEAAALAAAKLNDTLQDAQHQLKQAEDKRPRDQKPGTSAWRDDEHHVVDLQRKVDEARIAKSLADAEDMKDESPEKYELAKKEAARLEEESTTKYNKGHAYATDTHARYQEEQQRKVDMNILDPAFPEHPGQADPAAIKAALGQIDKRFMGSQNEKLRTGLSAVHGALGDGQGNQGAELAIAQELMSKMSSDSGKNQALVSQAVKMMEDQQAEGSKMQMALTRVMSGLISNQQSLSQYLQSLEGEVSGFRLFTQR